MAPPPAIGLYGGMALLISSITGPGLTTIPLLFQQAGWFTPTLAFLVFGTVAFVVSLFLIETMSTIHGNEAFQAKVEYSTVAHLYLGNKWHILMQVLLYFALQSVNISSIIISEQTMDSLLIRLFNKTCAVSFTEGWICVSKVKATGSPFDSYIIFSLGYLISACMVIPLSMMSLVENIKFQLASVAALFFVMVSWVYIFASHGLNEHIPAFGSNQGSLVGFVLNNFAFITTIPSFINELSRHVSIHRVILLPLLICVATYFIIGLLGAASLKISGSSDIVAALSASDHNNVLITIVNITFPVAVLVTSIPVFAIVIRYNLVRGNLCSNKTAIFLASVIPWILIIPFQTKGWLIMIMNWTALIFGSTTNFIIPLILYLRSKTYSASTADTTGGDIFVLYPQPSDSNRRSTHITRRASIPEIIIPDSPNSSRPNTSENSPPSPLLVVHPPPSSESSISGGLGPKPVVETTTFEDINEPSTSTLDPHSLRVVYSPSVSRSGSISHSVAEPPAITLTGDQMFDFDTDKSEIDSNQNRNGRLSSFDRLRSTSIDIRPSSSSTSSSHLHRRSRSGSNRSAHINVDNGSGTELAPIQFPSRARTLSIEERAPSPSSYLRETFKAFPEKKYWKSMIVAKAALVIVSASVVGNLVYTIVDTAKGNNPLSN